MPAVLKPLGLTTPLWFTSRSEVLELGSLVLLALTFLLSSRPGTSTETIATVAPSDWPINGRRSAPSYMRHCSFQITPRVFLRSQRLDRARAPAGVRVTKRTIYFLYWLYIYTIIRVHQASSHSPVRGENSLTREPKVFGLL
jgi:hypothetical protein